MLVQPSKARHVAISCKSWKLSFTLAEPINYERNWRPLAVQLCMTLYTKVLVVSCGERILMTSKQPSWSQQRTGWVMLPSGYSVASSNLTLKYSMQVSHGGFGRELTMDLPAKTWFLPMQSSPLDHDHDRDRTADAWWSWWYKWWCLVVATEDLNDLIVANML